MSLEDTALPARFGQPERTDELISVNEMVGKLRAALSARRDPSLVIAGRTSALKVEGTEQAAARAKAYAATGVDAIFIIGVETLEQIQAIHAAARLPVIVGSAPASSTREELAARGVRIALQGHQPVAAAVRALREAYTHLFNGGAPAGLKDKVVSPQEMERLVNSDAYKQWQRDYLR